MQASRGFVGYMVVGAGLGYPCDDPIFAPVLRRQRGARSARCWCSSATTAAARALPGGGGMILDLCHPRYVDALAARRPNLTIIAGRPAWPWQDEMIAVLLHKPNVWYELHGWSPKYFTDALKHDIPRRLKNRVMFGADYPLFTYERLVADWRSLGYDEAVLDQVMQRQRRAAVRPGRGGMSALAGKVAIVGGASQGIGYAIARRLAGDGADVAMVARRAEPLDAAAARIRDETGRQRLRRRGRHPQGRRLRAHRRGAARAFRPSRHPGQQRRRAAARRADELRRRSLGQGWQQNFMSVVRLTRGAMPAMRAAGGGRIVNITALSVLQPMPKFGLSVATWAGVIGYAKTLSLEVAADNITVNTICPGRIATGRLAKVFGTDSGRAQSSTRRAIAEVKKEIPLGRLGAPDEIAGLVALLVSRCGGYITGATFHVDGGRRANLL